MKRNRLLLLLALLMTAATGAWAQTSDKETPLTLQATADGWISISDPKVGMKYKVGDDGQMQTVTGTNYVTIDVNEGQTVQFFGNGTSITAYGDEHASNSTRFGSSVKCYIYGNIMSLVDETGFAKATDLTGDYAFQLLFSYFRNLSNHASRKLVLPAMTMTKECYYGMFLGCKGLTAAPALPAQKLAEGCYENMFDGCSRLTAAPELPATTLKEDCYYGMFSNCTSLTTAPLLPAPTLAEGCYCWMFDGCTNLNAVTCLATNISAQGATSNWLNNVAATGTLTIAKGMENNWTANSADGIPSGWSTDVYGFKVKLADGTADAGKWTATVGTSTTANPLPVGGLSNGDAVTLTYGGRLKVKSVTATTDAKPAATVTTAPTGAAVVGVGKSTALVSGGAADGGTLMYAVTTTNTMPTSTDGFSDAVPTAEDITASGKVYVWYFVKADGTHTDSEIAATAIEVPVADIVWDVTNVSDLSVTGTEYPYEKEGVTLSANAGNIYALWYDADGPTTAGISLEPYESGGFTFTAPTGKAFTKIEMKAVASYGWEDSNLGTGWAFNNPTVTWTGTAAASTVDLLTGTGNFMGANVKYIAFYLSE